MADKMEFPSTIEEFIKGYSFKDSDEVYTNGAELIPVFRVEQAFEHYEKEIREKAIDDFSERLKVVNKIIDIIKNEQQPTSCEHTKLKSFEMIEKIITDYQLRDSK